MRESADFAHPGGGKIYGKSNCIIAMSNTWPCPLCKANITGTRAKASHYKNLWKKPTDPTRCDSSQFTVPLILSPIEFCDDTATATATACDVAVGLVTTATSACGLYHLARRPFVGTETSRCERKEYTIGNAPVHARSGTYNMLRTQNAWDRYFVYFA